MPPIRPQDVKKEIPEFVFDAVNLLIVSRFNHSHNKAEVPLAEVITAIYAKCDRSSEEITKSGWLDFEDNYRAAGWLVSYEHPAYNEPREPYYIFAKS